MTVQSAPKPLADMLQEQCALVEASIAGRGAIAELEQAFCQWFGVRYAIAVSSGTLALYFALQAVGVRWGDEVIVPALDWFAAAAAVLHCGAIPRFADVKLRTYTISPRAVARCRTKRTRAVVATHLFGNPCDLATLRDWCDKNGVALIEDVSQAMGAIYDGKPVGCWGDAACLSLSSQKPLSTGEGGIILTPHESVYERLLALCTHPVRQVYAGLNDINPFALRAPLNPVGVATCLSMWQHFPQYMQQQRQKISELNKTIRQRKLPLAPIYSERSSKHAAYQLCPRLLILEAAPETLDVLQSEGWVVYPGTSAHYVPQYLQAAVDAGHWNSHPFISRLRVAAASLCPQALQLSRTLISVDREI